MSPLQPTICLMDGEVAGVGRTSLRLRGERVISVGVQPQRDDVVVELHGERVLPGLINAHDHLQLNNFPRVKFRDTHRNVGEWIADVDARRGSDARLLRASQAPRESRLWQGAFKNLLAGVTTVAHHDPLYPALCAPDFPLRVLADYGWAHSLGIDGEDEVRRSHRETPVQWPWLIHAGEGVDDAAAGEFERLDSLGCVTANARFIHGVAFGAAECERLAQARAGLVWCPASNLYLFGRTTDVRRLAARGCVALGTDSRLSGSYDLLDELREAYATGMVPAAQIESLVGSASAALLRLPDRGALHEGLLADLVILPRDMPLWDARRTDLRGVMLGGRLLYGDASIAAQLLPAGDLVEIIVDGTDKVLRRDIADALREQAAGERGVQWMHEAGRAA